MKDEVKQKAERLRTSYLSSRRIYSLSNRKGARMVVNYKKAKEVIKEFIASYENTLLFILLVIIAVIVGKYLGWIQ